MKDKEHRRRLRCWMFHLVVFLVLQRSSADARNIDLLPDEAFFKDGDLLIGGLGRVHDYDPVLMCSPYIPGPGIYQFGHATAFAVNEINARTDILPNVTLGYVVLDDCGFSITTAARAMQLAPMLPPGQNQMSYGTNYDVIGVVGPITTQASTFTATIYSFLQLPLISFAATGDDLLDRGKYPYFFRVLGADVHQAEAMVVMFREFGWNYVSAIYYEDAYGYDGIKNLEVFGAEYGICTASTHGHGRHSTSADYEQMITDLRQVRVHVVVVYTYFLEMAELAKAVEAMDAVGEFIFVFTDCFMGPQLPVFGMAYVGAIWLHPYDAYNEDFVNYLYYINPWTIDNDPWIEEFWMYSFQCTFEANASNPCSDYTSLSQAARFPILSLNERIVDAVYMYAAALDLLITERCPEARGNATWLKECATTILVAEYLYKVEVDRPSGLLRFNEFGEVIRPYEWGQFQLNDPMPFLKIETFAKWDGISKQLEFNASVLNWDGMILTPTEEERGMPEAVCSYPCGAGEIVLQGELECCWDCYQCRENEIPTDNATRCEACPALFWPDPDSNFTVCEPIEPTYLNWLHPYAIALNSMTVAGFFICLITIGIIVKYSDRKVIRGSGRDMICVLLSGVILGYISVPAFTARPTLGACVVTRIGFNLSPCIVFASLLLKTLRIHHVFAASKKLKRKIMCISMPEQLVQACMAVAVQMVITLITCIIWRPAAITDMPVLNTEYVELRCSWDLPAMLAPLIYNLLLLLACAVYGFLTRHLPDNYNESWYIFISVCTTLFIWIAFIPTYFAAFYAYHQAVLLAFALFLNITVVIGCIFGPKIYAVFFIDESQIKITNYDPHQFDSTRRPTAEQEAGTEPTAGVAIGPIASGAMQNETIATGHSSK